MLARKGDVGSRLYGLHMVKLKKNENKSRILHEEYTFQP